MPKDYAKNIFVHKHSAKRKIWRSSLKVWFFSGLLMCGIVFGVYLYKNKEFFSIGKITAWFSGATSTKTAPLSIAEGDQKKSVRFAFYTELPNTDVKAKITEKLSSPAKPLAEERSSQSIKSDHIQAKSLVASSHYILQIGIFKNQAGASQLRLSLLLAGVESEVVKTEIGDVVVYSVQKGPYENERFAKSAQKRLQKKGIESIVRKR